MASPQLDNVADVYPLTPLQEGMLFHALADPSGSVFVNQMTIRLRGELDPAAVRAAIERLVASHGVLRTAFVWDGLEQPLQIVRERAALDLSVDDWRGLPERDQEWQLERYLEQDRERGIDLAAAPLSRIKLIRTGPEAWLWVWTTHHLIADGWSVRVLLDELFADLAGTGLAATGESLRFRDFVALQASRDPAADEAHWRSILVGFRNPHRVEVPGLPAEGAGHGSHSVRIDAASSASLRDFAREQRLTLNTLFLGAWALVLSRWMRTPDVVFGVTSSGRDASLPGIEDAVGLFINTLPFRADAGSSRRVGDWLRVLQQQQLQNRPFEQSSLADVQRWSDIGHGDPLFETIYVFENLPAGGSSANDPPIAVAGADFVEHSNYPLAVLVHPEDEIEIQFIYDRSRLAADAVATLGAQMTRLLEQYPGRQDAVLGSLDLATAHPADWETGPEAPADDDRLIHEIILEVARHTPDAAAVIFEDRTVTYAELLAASQRLAHRLRRAGVGPNSLVGLLVPRSLEMVIGIIGILQAGGAYVPLDPAYPESHLSSLLEDDQISVVVTDGDNRRRVANPVVITAVDDGESVPEVAPAETSADDYAYVIHTSGSTGRPKGVPVTHRSLVNSTLARDLHYGSPVRRFLLLSSFAFDSSVVGIFWTLCTGGALVLPGPDREHDVAHLLALASQHQVTHLLGLPSLYQLLLEHDEEHRLSSLDVAIVAGEACPPSLVDIHVARAPGAQLHNEYGPTEATVWCSVHLATAADRGRPLPIGRPIAGTRIYVIDPHGHRVSPGFAGEIAIAGAGLSPGYLHRPDLTAERFVTLQLDGVPQRLYLTGDLGCFDPSGELLFLGRVDAQLKIRGHRIEPAAVESAIKDHRAVADAAVVGRSATSGMGQRLVAFVTASDGYCDADQLRVDLGEMLPRFMVPDVIVPIDSLPRLPNGKVDYASLPLTVEAEAAPFVAPRNDVEAKMAELWADVLDLDPAAVGIDADYFALGGDSLLAIRLMSAVRREFDTQLPLAALLEAPRLGDFCSRLRDGAAVESDVIVPIRGAGPVILFMIHPGGGNVLVYEPLARYLPEAIRSIGIQAHGIAGQGDPDRSVEAMAARYAAAIDGYLPSGPIHMVGHSTGGLVAFETARTLVAMGRDVGMLAMLDTLYPLGRSLPERLARQARTVREGGRRGVRTVRHWYWSTIRGLAGRLRHGPKWRYLLSQGRELPPVLAGKRINHIALRAQLVYEPSFYPGVITYIRATGDEDDRVQNSARMWEEVADSVVLRTTPGKHSGEDSLISEPHVRVVAEVIARELGVGAPQSTQR